MLHLQIAIQHINNLYWMAYTVCIFFHGSWDFSKDLMLKTINLKADFHSQWKINLHVELKSKFFFQDLILGSELGLRLSCINSDEASCSQVKVEHALKENLHSNTSDKFSVYIYINDDSTYTLLLHHLSFRTADFLFEEVLNSSTSI